MYVSIARSKLRSSASVSTNISALSTWARMIDSSARAWASRSRRSAAGSSLRAKIVSGNNRRRMPAMVKEGTLVDRAESIPSWWPVVGGRWQMVDDWPVGKAHRPFRIHRQPATRHLPPVSCLLRLVLVLERRDHVRIRQRRRVAQSTAFGDVAQQAAHDLSRPRLGEVG